MRFLGAALLGAVVLAACGGGESQGGAATDSATMPPVATPTGGAAAYAAPTGTIHEVKMVGDAQGYRYEPASITAKPGDGVKFIVESIPPHNVAFDPAVIPADQKAQLFANLLGAIDGSSQLLLAAGESVTLSLTNIAPGKYPFFCTPHLAMNMKGEIIIQ